jgi:hypothetical protein
VILSQMSLLVFSNLKEYPLYYLNEPSQNYVVLK